MKKIILSGVLLLTSAFAGCLNLTASQEDITENDNFMADSNRCFNAYDEPVSSSGGSSSIFSISTKTAGEEFYLHIFKKPYCAVTNVKYYLVDNITDEKIDGTEHSLYNVPHQDVNLTIPNSYKDVSIKFEYDKETKLSTPKEITCPTNPSDYKVVSGGVPSGIYAVPQPTYPITYKCYTYYETKPYIDYSTDNFAIRPDKIDGKFNTAQVKEGSIAFATLKTINKKGDITTNYNIASTELEIDGSAQYSFDINNGYTSRAQFLFLEPETQTISIIDKNFASVDEDDTVEHCRIFRGETSMNVIATSKYWAGTGTDENENDPISNNVQAKIKQNTKKDLHFQKMAW